MRQENYLYFATAGNNDADKDAVMYPASAFRGAVTISSTTTELFFAPRDGTGTVADGVLCTHADVATVVKDLNTNLPSNEGPISSTGLDEITAITITTH